MDKPEGRAWFFILLASASIANISISGLSGLSRISAGSAPLQWLAEVLNLLAHGSFAFAVHRLRPHIPLPSRLV